jgi:hypothetical protein
MMTPPAIATMSRTIPSIRSMAIDYPMWSDGNPTPTNGRVRANQVGIAMGTAGLEPATSRV